MTDCDRLMRTLFDHNEREHLDIKFFKGTSPNVAVDEICREANKAILQIESGMVEGDEEFTETYNTVDVATLVAKL